MVPTNKLKSNSYTNLEQFFNKISSKLDDFDLDLKMSPPRADKNNEPYIQWASSSPSLRISYSSLTTQLEQGHGSQLILMSCLSCFIHVMVSDANPKCPKCFKGDCLLDMYRTSII